MRSLRERRAALFGGQGSAREERLRLLATASQVLAASFDLQEPLQEVARLAVIWFADVAFIDLLGDKGELQRAAAAFAHADSERAAAVAVGLHDFALGRRVVGSGRPVLIGKPVAGALGPGDAAKSLLLVPLMSAKGPVGVLTLVSTHAARRFSSSDLVVARDLAGRIGTAVERSQLFNQAKEAVQARQDILAFVSHDLKNSLMSLFLNVEMLLRNAPPDERRSGWKQLDRIRRGVKQMRRMIEDLLDAGSIESGRLAIDSREHEIGELFQEAVELSAPLVHDKSIEIRIEMPPPPFKVRCDRERMMQVFSNLIGNAVKFVPERGTIVLSAAASGANALVAVRDTGPGIPAARLPHLFQRYWQADETARKGRGLGLFITKGIIEAQGGVIWAESQVGAGSTFFITLPLVAPIGRRELVIAGAKRPPRRAPPRLSGGGARNRIRAND
ncbi:MAG TPA: HAMP domain-containing sensor histidine kinase [Polyangia bacterium]|nr:HAMP domain-containing sensor histidine kinase [Polyangia bacterium]